MVALATVLALVVAPLVVFLTHGPAAGALATEVTAQSDFHDHGHDHEHGHADDAGHGHHGGVSGGHNPADHDHQLHAVLYQAASTLRPLADTARSAVRDVFRNLTPDGPRRPPRRV